MSDSGDDLDERNGALRRQKSIFSGMGRVRNMNQLRGKWHSRSKLSTSSDYASDTTTSMVSQPSVSRKQRGSMPSAVTAASVTARPVEPLRRHPDLRRYETVSTWIRQSGIAIPRVLEKKDSPSDLFDEMYASLEQLEMAVASELSHLEGTRDTSASLSDLQARPSSQKTEPVSANSKPHTVDYIVVVGPDSTDLMMHNDWGEDDNVFEATIAFAYPPESQFLAESIDQFCFPRGITVEKSNNTSTHQGSTQTGEDFFVLVLSGGGDQGQSVQYVCCMRGIVKIRQLNGTRIDVAVPLCYCVVASTPWIPLFKEMLGHLLDLHQQELDAISPLSTLSNVVPDALAHHIDLLMDTMSTVKLPLAGDEVSIKLPINECTYKLRRPRTDNGVSEAGTLLLEWAIPVLLAHMSIDKIVQIVGLLLVEMKVIVVSKTMQLLSAATLGLSSLLHPLSWAGPLITILPPSLLEYIEAPVPIVCGVEALPSAFSLMMGTTVVDIDNDVVLLHPDDEAQSGALKFPGSEDLARELAIFTDQSQHCSMETDRRSSAVITNVIVRRLRRHLGFLLNLCSRVNPCNAYACMKQENLSLSETLFLKSFMTSQMYQKYSDDLPATLSQIESWDSVVLDSDKPEPQISNQTLYQPANDQATAIKVSLRNLFMIATTGVCYEEGGSQNSIRSRTHSQTDGEDDEKQDAARLSRIPSDASNGIDTATRIFPKVIPSDSSQVIEFNSLTSDLEIVPDLRKKQWLKAFSLNPDDFSTQDEKFPTTSGADLPQYSIEAIASSPIHTTRRTNSLPTAQSKERIPGDFENNNQALSPKHDQMQQDVYRGDTEPNIFTLSSVLSWDQNVGAISGSTDRDLVRGTRPATPRAFAAALATASRMHKHQNYVALDQLRISFSAVKIQSFWRDWKTKPDVNQEAPLIRRGLVNDVKNELTNSDIIGNNNNDHRPPGVMLLLADIHGRGHEVWVHLSKDSLALEWELENSDTFTVPLLDISVVTAKDGIISIATRLDEYTFSMLKDQSVETMSFFRDLHERVKTIDRDEESSRSKQENTELHPRTPTKSRQAESQRTTRFDSLRISGNRFSATIDEQEDDRLHLYAKLRQGILVLKHGRRGRPHVKYLTCDDSHQFLMWRKPTITNAGYLMPSLKSIKAHSRAPEKAIRFDDTIKILKGKQTRVFQRSVAVRSDEKLCFSMVTATRTLDIEALSSEDLTFLLEGMSLCIPNNKIGTES